MEVPPKKMPAPKPQVPTTPFKAPPKLEAQVLESGEYVELGVAKEEMKEKKGPEPKTQEDKGGTTTEEEEELPDWSRDPSPPTQDEGEAEQIEWGTSYYDSSMFKTAFTSGGTYEKISKATEENKDEGSRNKAVANILQEQSCRGTPSSSAFHTGVHTPEELPIYQGYLQDSEFRLAFAKRLKEKLAAYGAEKLTKLWREATSSS